MTTPRPAVIALALTTFLPLADARSAPAQPVATRAAKADDPLEAARAAARATLVKRLDDLASWANDNELFAERDRLYKRVIEIAPDDAVARKGLRYVRGVDGSWKEPAPREARNMNKKALADLPAREAAATAPFSKAILDLATAPERTPQERDSLLAELRAAAPDDPALHELLGEVRMDDRWVMPETVRAKERRKEIKSAIAEIKAGVAAPHADAPTDAEKVLCAEWRVVLQGAHVRVLSTGTEQEADELLRAVDACGDLVARTLGGDPVYPANYTLYVVNDKGAKDAFLARLPDVSDADRARLAKLESAGLPNSSNVVLFHKVAKNRVDGAVRHTLGHLLAASAGLSPSIGWAWEGFGMYLTRELVGTRLTWFVTESRDAGAAGLRGKLMNPETNWMNEALTVLTASPAISLEAVMKKGLDALDLKDVVVGYALAAYLLEARADTAAAFVTSVAKSGSPSASALEVLKSSPGELQEKLTRWLTERR